jgi:ABC-type antimicrobial peptide transport system permease subunit
LGKRIRHAPEGIERTIVGVVTDVRDDGPSMPAPATAYWPLLTVDDKTGDIRSARNVVFSVRSLRAESAGFADDIRQAIAKANPTLAVADLRTAANIQRTWMSQRSMSVAILAIAAIGSLVLTLIGVYGIVARAVSHRIFEIGLRMALGATRLDVMLLFFRETASVMSAGLLLGLAGAFWAASLLSASVAEFARFDFWTCVATASIAAAASLVATLVPAARAARVEPSVAMRVSS